MGEWVGGGGRAGKPHTNQPFSMATKGRGKTWVECWDTAAGQGLCRGAVYNQWAHGACMPDAIAGCRRLRGPEQTSKKGHQPALDE